jgi:hypothetical protein
MAFANPVPGSVSEAAEALTKVFNAEPEGPIVEKAEDTPEAEAPVEETVVEAEAPEAEPEEVKAEPEKVEPEPDSTETESEFLEELPDTVHGIAEAIGMEDDKFLEHVQIPVKVNGETSLVNLKELTKGYSLESDYRHKTSKLSDDRRAFEKSVEESNREWQSRFQSLDGLLTDLQTTIKGEEESLDIILQNEGADAYLQAKKKIDEQRTVAQKAEAERQRATQSIQAQQAEAFQYWAREQAEALKTAMPEFAHPQKAQVLKDRIRDHAKAEGYDDDALANLYDHRHVITLWKAMQYDELQKAKPELRKKLKTLPRVQRPNAAPEKTDVTRQKTAAAVNRLRKSGTSQDAAKLFEGLL